MAMFPCSVCDRRYPGRQQTLYVHLVEGATELSARLRLCPMDFSQLHHVFEQDAILTQIGDDPAAIDGDEGRLCFLCGNDRPVAMLFAHAYPSKAERRSYMAAVCELCESSTQERFKIAP